MEMAGCERGSFRCPVCVLFYPSFWHHSPKIKSALLLSPCLTFGLFRICGETAQDPARVKMPICLVDSISPRLPLYPTCRARVKLYPGVPIVLFPTILLQCRNEAINDCQVSIGEFGFPQRGF